MLADMRRRYRRPCSAASEGNGHEPRHARIPPVMIQDVDGRRVEARWWGERGGTTLVLLHEGLGCVDLWRDFPERLAAATGCAVFAWSRPGYGRSGPV